MKPRIYLRGKYYWAGSEFNKWMCAGSYRVGFGPTPKAAYQDWMERVFV